MSKKPIMVEVVPRYDKEPFEKMIKRFIKKCKKECIVEDYCDRRYYEKPSVKRKRKKLQRLKVLEKLRIKLENKLNNN